MEINQFKNKNKKLTKINKSNIKNNFKKSKSKLTKINNIIKR